MCVREMEIWKKHSYVFLLQRYYFSERSFPLNCTDVTALSFVSRLKYIALRLDTIIVDDVRSEIHIIAADLVSGTPMQPEFSRWVVNISTKAIRKSFMEGESYTAEQLYQRFLYTWIGKVFVSGVSVARSPVTCVHKG